MRVEELMAFIKERHAIWKRRADGKPKPWTKDPILQSYRFCNVLRELDTVTQWVGEVWRQPRVTEKDLWFGMVVARLVNWPETLQEVGWPLPWRPNKFVDAMHKRRARGEKVFGGAYIVSTNGRAMDKAEYLAGHVLNPLWEARARIRPRAGDTLESFHQRLMAFDGMGSFMAAQVVADLKYGCPHLVKAADWHTWASSGPGSRRGLNRVVGRDKDAPWREGDWRKALGELQELVNSPKHFRGTGLPSHLHAQDLQNCLCEFDKYERTRLGEGKPRSSYPGT
jgi:hypothetical protein